MPMAPDPPGVRPSRLQLPTGPWRTLLDGLCARFPAIPRATWQDRFARGRVQDREGRPLDAATAYRVGLEIRYFREVPDEPPNPALERLLHVDADLVVADKPHGLPVTPAGAAVRETLLARLTQRLDCAALVPLHRIDRDTAGLVLFSRRPATRDAYMALFRERRIRKRYEALAPALPERAFPLEHRSRLVPGEPFFRMREGDGPPDSVTRVTVLERRDGLWRYGLEPLTGRKHQLRVHMAALGAPILHDPLYPALRTAAPEAAPLALLAAALAFDDPLTGAPRAFRSTLSLAWPGEPD